jgi:hypothetical protein
MPSLRVASSIAFAVAVVLSSSPAPAGNACLSASSDGQDQRAASKYREARASFLKCSATNCNAVVRANCQKWLAEIEDLQPTVVLRVVDAKQHEVPGARVTIDDSNVELTGLPISVDPGFHVIKATARSGEVVEQRMLVAIGEKARLLELRLPGAAPAEDPAHPTKSTPPPEPPAEDNSDPPSSGRSLQGPAVLGGVAALALGAFAYFEVDGHAGYRKLERDCFPTKTCATPDIDHVKGQFVGAAIAGGIAGVALAAAVILYFTTGSPASAAKAARLTAPRLQVSF